jgi:hypothetical protein
MKEAELSVVMCTAGKSELTALLLLLAINPMYKIAVVSASHDALAGTNMNRRKRVIVVCHCAYVDLVCFLVFCCVLLLFRLRLRSRCSFISITTSRLISSSQSALLWWLLIINKVVKRI